MLPGFVQALTHADVPHNVTILGLIGVKRRRSSSWRSIASATRASRSSPSSPSPSSCPHDAVARVKLDLEELPAVFDVEEALAPEETAVF